MLINITFPADIALNSTITTKYNTIIHSLDGGKEARNINNNQAVKIFNLAETPLSKSQIDEIGNIFHLAKGSAGSFYIEDWQNNNQQTIVRFLNDTLDIVSTSHNSYVIKNLEMIEIL